MRCANCGAENVGSSRFCANCGEPLAADTAAAAPAPDTAPAPQPVGAGPATGAAATTGGVGVMEQPAASAPPRRAPPANDFIGSLGRATESVDAALAPVRRALTPVADALAPLEGIGRQPLAWLGAALIIIGLFLPIKSNTFSIGPISGSANQNYWDLTGFGAFVFLVLALAAAGFAYLKLYVWPFIIGVVLFVFFLFGFINAFSAVGPGWGAHPSWGWILLIVGVLALLASYLVRDRRQGMGAA